MSEKKDRELSEKELKKAAGGGQPYGTPQRKDTKSPVSDNSGRPFGTPGKPAVDDSRGGKGKK